MKINTTIKHFKGFLDQNAPVILTGIAVSGAAITTYFAARAGYKSRDEILNIGLDRQDPHDPLANPVELTNSEKFLATYKFYLPAAATLVGTSTCMIMATKIGLDRTAALAGALVVAERANDQYKDKVKELFGDNKHVKVTDAVANDQVQATDLPEVKLLRKEGEQLYFDRWSARYFMSTPQEIGKALNDFNQEMIYGGYCSLDDWYQRLGLEATQEADEIGWNNQDLLELTFTTVLKNEQAVVAVEFDRMPMPGFQKVAGKDSQSV